ncbi:tetratricopeptide repeat protein [Sandaracinus amylolyticus]|uniref:Tetratricopeptide repeat protein n=1 Tax=Sandaracinus amylolyticus TaxID=927083 RepID=A0A0F6YK88_9BACT|nr:tetratricopeptide repeat protein [Sandaracinus amylolyticus]AKF08601.1 hypothetical protein DB32_005750 [Sandaracinus amylolyticus]
MGRCAEAIAIAIAIAGCVPTISQPRGEAHLDAMAEAGRHHSHGRDREAAIAYERAAEHAERRVDRDEAEWRQAQALRREGSIDDALAILDRIAERTPIARRTVRARFEAARLRLERGERDCALASLRVVVRDHPSHGQASRALVLLVRALREESDDVALAELRALDGHVASSDLHDDVLTHLAEIHLARGERAAARALYERIADEHPYPQGERWDDTLWRLADLAEQDGDPRAAIAYLERMITPRSEGIPPGSYTQPRMPDAALRIARLQRDALRDHDAAARAYRRAYDAFPTSRVRDDALVELGELQLDAGERDAGCATLRRATGELEVGAAHRRALQRSARDCR